MNASDIKRDAQVTTDDQVISRVTHVVVNPQNREVTAIIAAAKGDERLIPLSAITNAAGRQIAVRGAWQQFDAPGSYDGSQFEVASTGEARPVATSGSVARDRAAMDRGSAEQVATTEQMAATGSGQMGRLQLFEEQLRVGTVAEQIGSVTIRKQVVEHTEQVEVTVREERLLIDVGPGSGAIVVNGRALSEGEHLEITLTRERAVVTKEVVPIEEVSVRTETTERVERVEGVVRREELVVDDPQGLVASPLQAASPPRAAPSPLG